MERTGLVCWRLGEESAVLGEEARGRGTEGQRHARGAEGWQGLEECFVLNCVVDTFGDKRSAASLFHFFTSPPLCIDLLCVPHCWLLVGCWIWFPCVYTLAAGGCVSGGGTSLTLLRPPRAPRCSSRSMTRRSCECAPLCLPVVTAFSFSSFVYLFGRTLLLNTVNFVRRIP